MGITECIDNAVDGVELNLEMSQKSGRRSMVNT